MNITGLDGAIEYSLVHVAHSLSTNLLKQVPMLLPAAYEEYCNTFTEVAETHNVVTQVKPEEAVTSRYLLSYLVTRLHKHLEYTMRQCSAGVLLIGRVVIYCLP